MLGVLLLLQTASTPSCARPELCRLLERAEASNRAAALLPSGYRAAVETEMAMLGRREGRMEAATLVEQLSGQATWSNETGLDFHVVGSRSYSGSIPLSRMAFLRVGWIVPTLTGPRLLIVTRSGAGETKFSQTLSGALAPEIVVHPLANDRETYYRFSGGQIDSRRIELAFRNVAVVEVTPRTDFEGEQTLFEGELLLDPESGAVVRMVGRFRILGRPRTGGMFRLPDFEPSLTLVDLINQQLSNGDWVPLMQRFEIENASGREAGSGSARRVISRFREVRPTRSRGGEVAIGGSTMGYQVTRAPRDSLHRFQGWYTPKGQETQAVSVEDFSEYLPSRQQARGKPLFLIQGFEKRDFVRINRIEGLFTGVPLMLRLRDAGPGVYLHAKGGYAWHEKTFRGAARAGWDSPTWSLDGGVSRSLEVTNKFRNQFDSRALSALIGRDAWDYLNRREVTLGVTRSLEAHGSILRLEGAHVEDDSVVRNIESVLRGKLRPNRGLYLGTYYRAKALLDWNPEVSPLYARDGIGFRGEVELASGDFDYTRFEGRVVVRKTFTKMFFIARLHGGAVLADAPPPQQLFELGGPAGMPGYEYKEFAGDHAALFRSRLTYPLSVLDLPLRVSGYLTLPALAPAISVGFQAGYTGTRNPGGDAAVRALGDRYDYKTAELITDPISGDPLPASVPSDEVKTSVDVRIGFFGDALAIGVARALEKGRKLRFIFAFGRQF